MEDVNKTLEKLVSHGGQKYGELIERDFNELGILTAIYTKDIDGNIIEIQNWREK